MHMFNSSSDLCPHYLSRHLSPSLPYTSEQLNVLRTTPLPTPQSHHSQINLMLFLLLLHSRPLIGFRNQPISQPTNQPTKRPTDQPTNQPTIQPFKYTCWPHCAYKWGVLPLPVQELPVRLLGSSTVERPKCRSRIRKLT